MQTKFSKAAGYTLLEIILVLVIAASVIILGMRQYLQYKNSTDIDQVKYNINVLMQGINNFYRANCAAGKPLDPATNNVTTYPIDISSLMAQGYLTTNAQGQFVANNPIVDASQGKDGYFAQLNRTIIPRTICTATSGAGACTASTNGGNIVIWTAQVGVALTKPSLAPQYQTLLNAACTSSARGGNEIVDCSQAGAFQAQCVTLRSQGPVGNATANQNGCPPSGGTYNNFLVWQQLPSFFSNQGQSPLWLSRSTVQQFTQQYTTAPITYLTGSTSAANNQYFLCVQ